ncbi:hypothetical protein [Helicobacter labacensis]|uniref:hypothetical protein n=1 Tax=Helicobacter labacensis TaxID=2316079 RepID=UPI000EAEDBE7|nr:hypothetical protein [Helicobacter labacensis]
MRWAYDEVEALGNQYQSMVLSIRSRDPKCKLVRTGLEILPDHQMRLLVVYRSHGGSEGAASVLMKYGHFVKKSFELGPAVLDKYGESM